MTKNDERKKMKSDEKDEDGKDEGTRHCNESVEEEEQVVEEDRVTLENKLNYVVIICTRLIFGVQSTDLGCENKECKQKINKITQEKGE